MTTSQRPIEPPIELPDEDPVPELPLFDLPDDAPLTMPLPEVLPPDDAGAIRELVITPDVEAYLAQLERAIAPYEAAAQAFAHEMNTARIATASELKYLGEQSLVAKEREKAIEALFEPAIRKPRLYLDRVYDVRRRVLSWWQIGGKTAARRYTDRQRELEEADRRLRAEADRQARVQQQEVDRLAAIERLRLASEATRAAEAGHLTSAADLVEQMRAIVPDVVVPEAPPSQAAAGKVAGLGARQDWDGTVTDLKLAILASARPDILREVADAIAAGDCTAGGQTITTQMIATHLRALALELPAIPSSMFQGNPEALKARARADQDTLQWPGFAFAATTIPVRRGRPPKATV